MGSYIDIDASRCIGCRQCREVCTRKLFSFIDCIAVAHTTTDNCMKCNLCVAICPTEAIKCELDIPPITYNKATMSVDPDRLLGMIKYRRSMRRFADKRIPKSIMDSIIEAADYAPKGNNRDLFRFIIIQDKIEEYRETFMKELKIIAQSLPDNSKLISARTEEERNAKRVRMGAFYDTYKSTGEDNLTFKAPCLVIILANKSMGGRPLWDSGITSAYMELEATSLGLGSCYLGFAMTALENSHFLQQKIGMQDWEIPASIMAFGYPNFCYKRTAPRKKTVVTFP